MSNGKLFEMRKKKVIKIYSVKSQMYTSNFGQKVTMNIEVTLSKQKFRIKFP